MATGLDRLKEALADRYRVERELGRGGMAIVYLAYDLKHDRAVALKLVRAELATALGPDRFLREIAVTARLDHPHILPLLDSGEADGLLYYVMPYVEGESLRDRLQREKQLPLDDALQIVREVADALSYAHGLGIVHRDIKPENILLAAGHARVADFGIARAVEAVGEQTLVKLTQTGMVLGSPLYMSPEQATGARAVEPRSDVYSLGCILYEMLAGQPPFTGPTAESLIRQHLASPAPAIMRIRPSVPDRVAAALDRALAKTPADRFATAAQFAGALERGAEPLASPSPTLQQGRRWRVVLVAVTGVVALTAGWWGVTQRHPPPPRMDSIGVLPLANFTGDPGQQHFVDATHDGLIAELAQIGALTVVSRQSVLRYRETEKALPDIARELNVDALVEGSVFRAGDTVRITVQLLQARPTERHLWAGTFQRDLGGILALQGQVARAIAERVEVTVSPGELARLTRDRPVDPAAYQAWLRGWVALTERSADRCILHAEESAATDPNYAPAYVLAAECYMQKAYLTQTRPHEAFPNVKAAAEQAIKLDPLLGGAYAQLAAYLANYEWDWGGADGTFQRAIELAPSEATTHSTYSLFLAAMGRHDKAIEHARRAEQLSPGRPSFRQHLSFVLYLARRYDEAIAQAQRTIELAPNLAFAHFRLAQGYAAKGMYDEAVTVFERGIKLAGDEDVRWKGYLARTYGLAGRRGEASRILGELLALEQVNYVPPTAIAVVHLGLGQLDEAMNWLEKAYQRRDGDLFLFKNWHGSDPLRSDERFQRLLRQMGFPQ